MKDSKNANSLFQRRLPCCRRPRVLRSLISAREQKKQPRISFVESRIGVSMFFCVSIVLLTSDHKDTNTREGYSRDQPEFDRSMVWDSGKRKISWRDTGFDHYYTRHREFAKILAPRDAVLGMRCWGKKNGVRYLSDISSRFRIVVKKEQECAIRNPPSGPCKRASAAQQQTKSVVYVYARVAVWYKINIHSNHFSHTMRSLVLVWSRCELNAFLTLLLSSKTSRKS